MFTLASLTRVDFCSCGLQASGGWAEDQTSRASLDLNTRVGRVRDDLETRGQTGDHLASAVSRSLLRTSLKEEEEEEETSPQTSE